MRFAILFTCVCSLMLAGETRLGKPFTQSRPVAIGKILDAPDSFVGKTVQVKGKVTEVCEMMGCWINLIDPGNQSMRVKVNDGDIVFPRTAIGKTAVAEGKLVK